MANAPAAPPELADLNSLFVGHGTDGSVEDAPHLPSSSDGMLPLDPHVFDDDPDPILGANLIRFNLTDPDLKGSVSYRRNGRVKMPDKSIVSDDRIPAGVRPASLIEASKWFAFDNNRQLIVDNEADAAWIEANVPSARRDNMAQPWFCRKETGQDCGYWTKCYGMIGVHFRLAHGV